MEWALLAARDRHQAITTSPRGTVMLECWAMEHPSQASLLREVVTRIWRERGKSFVGAGLIVYDRLEAVPVSPLRTVQPPRLPLQGVDFIVDALLRFCQPDNAYHDGFHMISSDGYLTKVAMYFSPPIVSKLRNFELDHVHGGRYRAALFGSCVPSVLACGIVSNAYGPVIFEHGVPTSLCDTLASRSA
jgi:hypothetical protein